MASANMSTSPGQPLPPAKRRILQQQFEHGTKSAAKGDFSYAENMFTLCVAGDPGNPIYTKTFLETQARKYNNNKKGSKLASLSGMGHKASIKKASVQKDWPGVIKAGLEMLKLNPWDVSALLAMAAACENLDFGDCQLLYLKNALDANPKDADVNRTCGKALGRMGHFDQAIACWHRVEQAKPGDEEAAKAIGNLHIDKTIGHGGYEDANSSTDVKVDKSGAGERNSGGAQLTQEQTLERAIAKNPADIGSYLELAEVMMRDDRFEDAEGVLTKALDASGGDMTVRERLEDTQLRRGRQQLAIAEKKAKEEKTKPAAELANRMKAECNRVELEVYRSRSERHPTNLGYKYELGLRLKRAGQYKEAVECFQKAREDAKRKSTVYLELGECFQHIQQYKLAMSNYERAIEEVSERDPEGKKIALYRAGVLSYGMRDMDPSYLDQAEKHLTVLAGMEFGYKDVSERLDKIAKLRNKE